MIEIIYLELVDEEVPLWSCWLEISQAAETWMLPATAPGTLNEGDLQAYFDAQESQLWTLAQAKQYAVDMYEHIPLKRLLKAFALVVLDEINLLRQAAGLPERTPAQLVTAIKLKLKG